MDDYLIQEVEKETREQSASKLWQEMRYARITASKVYEVVKCKTLSGSLVETILGAKIFQTKAIKVILTTIFGALVRHKIRSPHYTLPCSS